MKEVEYKKPPIPKPIDSLMGVIQKYQKELDDAKKSLAPDPPFEVGDKVVVEGKYMRTVYGKVSGVRYNQAVLKLGMTGT